MDPLEDMKDTLFNFCDFYRRMADDYLEMLNLKQAEEYNYKEIGVMAIIESLGLKDEYEEWRS